MVKTPVASPIPKIATNNAANNRLGIVRTSPKRKRIGTETQRLSVTTVVANRLTGIAATTPKTVPKKDICNVLIKGIISCGR